MVWDNICCVHGCDKEWDVQVRIRSTEYDEPEEGQIFIFCNDHVQEYLNRWGYKGTVWVDNFYEIYVTYKERT